MRGRVDSPHTDDRPELPEEVVQVHVAHVVGDVEDEQVAALRPARDDWGARGHRRRRATEHIGHVSTWTRFM